MRQYQQLILFGDSLFQQSSSSATFMLALQDCELGFVENYFSSLP